MKTHWIAFLFTGLFFTASAYAEKNYLDYLNQVRVDFAESESELSRGVRELGFRYGEIADDGDFEELKTKTVLLWVVQECHSLARLYAKQPNTLAISINVSSLYDFKEEAKTRASEAASRALSFSVDAARLEYRRQNLTAQLFLERMKTPEVSNEFVAVLEARKMLETEIKESLHKELSLHEAIPLAYVEAALHVAVAALIREDLGEIEEMEETMAAFNLLLDSATTSYANALVFFGSTLVDSEAFGRGLNAIDGAEVVHQNALDSAERFL